jgi:excisionase family DNA binding protein
LTLAVPDEFLEALARRVATLLAAQLAAPPDGWLDVEQAAAHLSCRAQRVYDLVSEGRLRRAKDGRRLLFRREWLDAYVLEEDGR